MGLAGDLNIKDREIFEDLLDVCQLRGRDSTGVIRVNRQGTSYNWAKRVGPPAYLLDSRDYEKTIKEIGVSALVGHCRAKTIGEVNIRNAHPFDINDKGIVGVHNGTLRNYTTLSGHSTGNSDSRSLYETIGNDGAEETFAKVEGAYACVWWDQNAATLNFIRNKERPLWYTYSKDKRKMYWASEPWMFGAVYRKEELWDGDGGKIYRSLEEDILYSVEINANAPANKPVFKVMEGKKIEKKPFSHTYGYAHTPAGRYQQTSTRTPTTTTSSSTPGTKTIAQGGEVANPFLDDDIPQHLKTPAKLPVSNIKSGTTPQSNVISFTPSKSSADLLTPLTNTTPSESNTTSRPVLCLPGLPKTNRNVFFEGCDEQQLNGLNAEIDRGNVYNAEVGVDTRYIRKIDTEYITDLRTGVEVDEHKFRTETGGHCCHCNSKLVGLNDVAEIYDNGKRYICKTCVTPFADPIVAKIKEQA